MSEIGFWVAAGAMVLAVLALFAVTLARAAQAAASPAANGAGANPDLAVYKQQLGAIDGDLARGLIPADEAGRLKTEIARRLLDADRAAARAAPVASGKSALPKWALPVAAGVLVAAVPAYLWLGAPGYPDLPIRERLALSDDLRAARPHQAEAEARAPKAEPSAQPDAATLALVDKLRRAVAARPNDVQGLTLLARFEASLGNLPAARAAQEQLVTAKGAAATAEDYASLAEAMVLAAGGTVTPEAEAALTTALKRDPANGTAGYYYGLMAAQVGRFDLTFRLWAPLLDRGPEDAPWIAPIRAQIADVAARAGENYTPPAPMMAKGGPSAADVQAAAGMSDADRQTMIAGMVEGLANRLATQGGPAEDWAKLIRALGVQGQTDRARAILAEARTRFAADTAAMDLLAQAARDGGITP